MTAATTRFRPLAEDIVDDLLRFAPEAATELGDHRYDDQLSDLSESGLAAWRQVFRAHLDELDSLDLDDLGPQDAVDAEMLRAGLDREVFALDRLREHTWNPLVWLPGDAVYPLLVRNSVPVPDRLRAVASRLAAVPDRLAAARATLVDMPAVHVETAVGQASGALALIRDQVPALLAADPGLAGVVEPAQRAALAALTGFRTWLAEQQETASGEPRLGAELFAAKLHLVLDADLSAEQVVTEAEAALTDITAALSAVAAEWVGAGDDPIRRALDRAARDAPDDRTIVALAERTLAETTEFVRRTGIVAVPDDRCEIEVMPEFRRGIAVAYCDAPGPLESGGVTYYAISPTPSDWPADRVASFYREYNTAMMINMTVHEAMPGHVLQLARARQYRGATRVRQVLASGPFVEGWAAQAERIMAELGCGGLPVRLQQLKMQLRMTINALLDAGVHAAGMGEAEALDLMTCRGFQEEGEAVGKWRRALLTSTQLSTYFVGYTELAPLLAGRSTYDDVLAHGSPPPRHLAALLAAAG